MTHYISLVLTVLFAVLFIRVTRDVLHPGVLFNTLWFLVSLLYITNPVNLFEIAPQVAIISTVGVLSFNTPLTLLLLLRSSKKITPTERSEIGVSKISVRRLHAFQLLLLLLMAPLVVRTWHIFVTSGLGAVRYMYSTNESAFMSQAERVFYIYAVVFPCVSGTFLLSTFLWAKGRVRLTQMILGLMCYAVQIIITGGRMMIVDAALYFMLAHYGSRSETRGRRPKRWQLLALLASALLVGVTITLGRSAAGVNPFGKFLTTVELYLTIGPRLLQNAFANPPAFGLDKLTFGGVFLAGIIELVRWAFLLVGINLPSFFTSAQQYMAGYYFVGANAYVNAFPTMFYYFMRDFGPFGIILESAVFGVLAGLLYTHFRSARTLWSGLIYSWIVIAIFYSPFWWHPYRVDFWTPVLNLIWIIPMLSGKSYRISRRERGLTVG